MLNKDMDRKPEGMRPVGRHFFRRILTLSLWWLSPPDNLSLWRYFLNFKMLSNYIIPCRE
jgi:hypothetical protein